MTNLRELLHDVTDRVADHRAGLADARVSPELGFGELVAAMDADLRDEGVDAAAVIDELIAAVEPGLVQQPGPRYFGFVIGGSVDAAVAADVLTAGWDQSAFNNVSSPAAAAVEHVAAGWLRELLRVPASASVGFVTGAQAANTVGLAAGRHHVLEQVGWDVERKGLLGAPRVRIIAGAERHVTVDRSLRLLGFGDAGIEAVPAGPQGAIDVAALGTVLAAGDGPTIVCLQTGNVNTGACDDLRAASAVAHEAGAWVHIDGAFGLWAAASPAKRSLVDGIELADSWGCDGHKWLNVPYDSAYALCAHPDAHGAAMALAAAYLAGQDDEGVRNPSDWCMEASRRARGFTTWAALRQLGRRGVADLVDRCCTLAVRFADGLAAGGCEIRNDVVLNQVLVAVAPTAETTDRIVDAIQRDGTCWLGATTWRGERLLRISVSNHTTTEEDVDRSVAAILRARAGQR
jgi:glutamate/tyrosine decarboxylase-like PLP-dependent enzyme